MNFCLKVLSILVVLAVWELPVSAAPISQVDRIEISNPAYVTSGDTFSLTVTGPINSTATFQLTNLLGCNLCNATVGWGNAINSDPVLGAFLTATFDVWDGVSTVPFGSISVADYDPIIYLTANTPGVAFNSSVSVSYGTPIRDPDNRGFVDLEVSVSTITEAVAVSEPAGLVVFSIGLLGLACIRRRKAA